MLAHWAKRPPLHRVMAAFVGWGQGEGQATAAPAKSQPFEITPQMTKTFGNPCRQSSLTPRIRKSVEEFQSTEAYKNWRSKVDPRNKRG